RGGGGGSPLVAEWGALEIAPVDRLAPALHAASPAPTHIWRIRDASAVSRIKCSRQTAPNTSAVTSQCRVRSRLCFKCSDRWGWYGDARMVGSTGNGGANESCANIGGRVGHIES